MLKLISIITNWIIATLIALLLGSCNSISNQNSITGSGNVVTENRPINEEFKAVSISNGLNLVLEQSDKVQVSVQADDNLVKEIKTQVQNGVLLISTKFGNFNQITSKKITVKMPNIEELEANSAATIDAATPLKGNQLTVESSSGATIDITANFEHIYLQANSASQQYIKGKALKVEAKSKSAGLIDASELLSNEVQAAASSGGSMQVYPILILNGEASSGGIIRYKIKPKTTLQVHESSGGTISQD